MGGIVDVGIRSPNPDGKYHGLAQFDLIDGRVLLERPVPLLKGWSFLAGARRSWVDTWLKPVLKEAGAGVTSRSTRPSMRSNCARPWYLPSGFGERMPTSTMPPITQP